MSSRAVGVLLIVLLSGGAGALIVTLAGRTPRSGGAGCDEAVTSSGRLTNALQKLLATNHFPAQRTSDPKSLAVLQTAVKSEPQCAAAWDKLATARYWEAYRPCDAADYTEAERTVRHGLSLQADDATRASLWQTLGQIQAAQGSWDDARTDFQNAAALGKDRQTKRWLDDVRTFQSPSRGLLDAVAAVKQGRLLTSSDLQGLDRTELHWVQHAIVARESGRQFNIAPLDVFLYCSGRFPLNAEARDDAALNGTALVDFKTAGGELQAAPALPPLPPEQEPPMMQPEESQPPALASADSPMQMPPEQEPELQAPPPDFGAPIDESAYGILGTDGQWFEDPDVGRVWQPNPEEVGSDFQPYVTDGQWTSTDQGWVFASTFAWGQLTFHYGCWWFEPGLQSWVWAPGTNPKWTPASVQWMNGAGGRVGWQPRPPPGHSIPSTIHGRSSWHFVALKDLASAGLQERLADDATTRSLLTGAVPEPAQRGPAAAHPVPIRQLASAMPLGGSSRAATPVITLGLPPTHSTADSSRQQDEARQQEQAAPQQQAVTPQEEAVHQQEAAARQPTADQDVLARQQQAIREQQETAARVEQERQAAVERQQEQAREEQVLAASRAADEARQAEAARQRQVAWEQQRRMAPAPQGMEPRSPAGSQQARRRQR